MMIVDECHHVSALMFEKVVAQFRGKYLYGLTATPERKNGHEPIVFRELVRYSILLIRGKRILNGNCN